MAYGPVGGVDEQGDAEEEQQRGHEGERELGLGVKGVGEVGGRSGGRLERGVAPMAWVQG